VTDPQTQQDAPAFNVMKVDCAAMTNTADQAWVRFVTDATTPTLATTNNGGAAWGNAPGVRATPTRVGAGHFRLTWPTDIVDGLGVSHVVNFVRATVMCEGSTCVHAQPSGISANVVDVYTFNAAGTANDIVGTTIHVRVG
jgi:hypothetical protein